jgi:hypothetical protein
VKGLAGLWRASRGAAREEEAVASRAMVLVMVSFMFKIEVMVRSRCVGLCKRGLVVLGYLTRNVSCEQGGSR